MGRHRRVMRLPVAVALAVVAVTPSAAIELDFPLACTIGTDCAIQHYVDRDPGPDAVDYRCGHHTYDGHKGTDIRVPTLRDMASGVEVLAAADGEVAALRDDIADILVDDADPASIAGRECGNGVLIDDGGGWVTQYCHMKRGSIGVKVGDRVTAGAPLGQVGLSGDTQFPHLHFEVRKDDAVVDPFAVQPLATGAACPYAGDDQSSLWAPEAKAMLAYRPSFVLNVGFSNAVVTMDQVESGVLEDIHLAPDSPAIVFFGRAIGLETGDVQHLALTGPGGEVVAEDDVDPVDRPKDQFFAFTGRKRHEDPWPSGTYRGRYSVIRDGKEIAVGQAETEIR